jgi:predicted MPP superfamily phosphohydrolase
MAVEHRGRRLVLGGTEVPWMGTHPDFSSAPDAFRLLLSHTPDHLEWARQQQADLMLSGHNHGGQVVLPVIGPVYSPSRFGVQYAAGAFWSEPTLLYVSRGVSGRHPLRWNCRPEVTKLVLRADAQRQPSA